MGEPIDIAIEIDKRFHGLDFDPDNDNDTDPERTAFRLIRAYVYDIDLIFANDGEFDP